jgi:hypothetical protein
MKTKTLVVKPLKVAERQTVLPTAPEASNQVSTAQQPESLMSQGLTLESMTAAQQIATGLVSLTSGLGQAAKKAAFSIGFGALGMGGVMYWAEQSGRSGTTAVALLSIGAFFVLATVGKLLDRWARTPGVE